MKIALFLLLSLGCHAKDLALKNGIVLKDVKLEETQDTGAVLSHLSAKGRVRLLVPLGDLPECEAKAQCLKKLQAKEAKEAADKTALLQSVAVTVGLDSPAKAETWLGSHAFMEFSYLDTRFRLVDAKPKFVYNIKVKKLGGVKGTMEGVLTLIGQSKGTAFTRKESCNLEPGGFVVLSFPLFTGPSSVHGDACIARWRFDVGERNLASGDVPAAFLDEISRP